MSFFFVTGKAHVSVPGQLSGHQMAQSDSISVGGGPPRPSRGLEIRVWKYTANHRSTMSLRLERAVRIDREIALMTFRMAFPTALRVGVASLRGSRPSGKQMVKQDSIHKAQDLGLKVRRRLRMKDALQISHLSNKSLEILW